MKPIAIFRFIAIEGPGYLAEFLEARRLSWRLIAIDAGDAVPHNAADYAGLVFMGGPMSVNDDLPWIAPMQALIRDAVAHDVPVLGHCLGGQLISSALGGVITRNPVKEIGWGEVTVADNDIARDWLGELRRFDVFHWHGETFSLPRGTTRLLSSAYCANQGYAFGKHLALQCHVEMNAEMIATWCVAGADELAGADASPAVQTAAVMQQQAEARLVSLHAVADRLYSHWIKGLRV